ncbi:Ig-like domain-containing protein [Streptomyces sp. NPDC008121]|uniref:L,D-transpeptidase n=1 Tax=Streptomyces sp. NPDC008121 TaxID=3364809 RepID=UPI0036E02569
MALAAAVVFPVTAHAASPGGEQVPLAGPDTAAAARPAPQPAIVITPGDGALNASVSRGVDVTTSAGKLVSVEMKRASGGAPVPGSFSPDGTGWKSGTPLAPSTAYTVKATARDAHGQTVSEQSAFTTGSPSNSFTGHLTPQDGSTVGVGMPVSVNFDKPITDKKAVQSAIQVTSTGNQQIAGHWLSPTRLDFRPEHYWKPGSDVTVRLRLEGVRGGSGITGTQNKTLTFHIGRSQVSTVDAKSRTMTVVRDGKTVRTLPVTAGAPESPTYNGQMVISEKHDEKRMNGATVGFTGSDGTPEYDIPDVPHAMRLSASGTFLHGNYWAAPSTFGSQNTSHGCIGLSDVQGGRDPGTPAAWFYSNSLVGDVIIVTGSGDRTIQPGNGLSDWNMPWSTWLQGSAL